MSKRRFEFVGGNSSKFWEIEVTGNEVTVCFGRIGTTGQRQTKPFDDGAQAVGHAEKQIASKLKKGYAEVVVA
jgi:predicted DNA-binding WGR domain protein